MRITSRLTGGLRFESDIRGHQVIVDLPEENGGTDTGAMPPELLATALGTCVGVYAVQFCMKHEISTEGMVIHTDWDKAKNPSRIGAMAVTIQLPAGIPEEKHEAFMKTVHQCMVHNTLCNTPEMAITLEEKVASC